MNLPTLKCRGLCHQSCGPIAMNSREFQRLKEIVGERIQGEPFVNGSILVSNFDPKTMLCPLLTPDKRCSVYANRPMICRLYGMVKKMRCPFGCRPSRWISDAEAMELLK